HRALVLRRPRRGRTLLGARWTDPVPLRGNGAEFPEGRADHADVRLDDPLGAGTRPARAAPRRWRRRAARLALLLQGRILETARGLLHRAAGVSRCALRDARRPLAHALRCDAARDGWIFPGLSRAGAGGPSRR